MRTRVEQSCQTNSGEAKQSREQKATKGRSISGFEREKSCNDEWANRGTRLIERLIQTEHPAGTVADVPSDDDIKRDGIEIPPDPDKTAALRSGGNDHWCGDPPPKARLLANNPNLL